MAYCTEINPDIKLSDCVFPKQSPTKLKIENVAFESGILVNPLTGFTYMGRRAKSLRFESDFGHTKEIVFSKIDDAALWGRKFTKGNKYNIIPS